MFRRRFFKLMTLATAGGLVPLEAMTAGASKIVTYRVNCGSMSWNNPR
jgi:hypothetical protein